MAEPIYLENLYIGDKREFRVRKLLDTICGCPCSAPSQQGDVAGRLLSNITMTISDQEKFWRRNLTPIFKRPLPFDSANPLKPSLYTEMMTSVGDEPVYLKVKNALTRGSFEGSQKGKHIAALLGVSGMGKTKVSYDIGREYAFAIITRIVEHEALTSPWQCFHRFANHVENSTPNPSLVERISLKSAIVLLLVAHLRYAIDISRAVEQHEEFDQCVQFKMDNVACTSKDIAKDLVLKEAVLRGQRNGYAYSAVSTLFQNMLRKIISTQGTVSESGELNIPLSEAIEQLKSAIEDGQKMWGSYAKIVFFYDEIQALISMPGISSTLFEGVYMGSRTESGTAARQPCGCFYGLLATIRDTIQEVTLGHVLLGHSHKVSEGIIAENSPAQGHTQVFEEAFHLDETHIDEMLKFYLTENAYDAIDKSILLLSAIKKAVDEAADRIDSMWNNSIQGLISYLFYSIVMNTNGDKLPKFIPELLDAIHRGILNCKSSTADNRFLEWEPITKEALIKVGMQRLRLGTDGIMALLASRMTTPVGAKQADQGEALKSCFSWALVRKCLLHESPIQLVKLLRPFFPPDHKSFEAPNMLEDYEVHIDSGVSWSSSIEGSPFSALSARKRSLFHHMNDAMAGPDIIHVAIKSDHQSISVPVLYQLKNRSTGTVVDAVKSLDLGRMHPGPVRGSDRQESETPEHNSFRSTLDANKEWLCPVRVVVSARPYAPSLLYHVAWFNRHQWNESPLVLLTVNKKNLEVDISPSNFPSYYGAPKSWLSLCPSKSIRHSGPQIPIIHNRENFEVSVSQQNCLSL